MEYHFLADAWNKFHTALPWVQALMVVVWGVVTVMLAYSFKEMVAVLVAPFRGDVAAKKHRDESANPRAD